MRNSPRQHPYQQAVLDFYREQGASLTMKRASEIALEIEREAPSLSDIQEIRNVLRRRLQRAILED